MNETQKKAVISNSKWIDNVLWSGTLASFAIILAKIFGGEKISIPDVGFDINLNHAWFIICLMTIAHFYTMLLFVKSAKTLWKGSNYQDYKSVFDDITSEGGMFFRDFKPRLVNNNQKFAEMSWNDLSTWTSHIAAIFIFFSVIPLNFGEIAHKWWLVIFAVILTYLNWMIGSQWAIALSELAVDKEKSKLLAK